MAAALTSLQSHLADRYRIERELGRGGMGTVYLAEDLKHHRRVAIKVLEPELAAALGRERFLREIETVARLTHPHILPLHDSGSAGELLYYVMPYVEGESLQVRLAREKQLPLDDALRIAREVADALAFAHGHGVVHRDIKPGNILLQGGHAVVADFGLARAIASAGVDPAAPTGAGTLTASGMALGTPAYMSPEQAAGVKDVDGRSDLYALGCVLYELLAGQPPFMGPTVESLVHQHLSVMPRPVTDLRPAVPMAVRDALAKALAKTPADRFATTAEFAAALAATKEIPRPLRMPWRIGTALAMVLAFTYGGLAMWWAWWPFTSRMAPPPTKQEWVVVSEFTGSAGDASLLRAAREIVCTTLDQSRVLASVSREQLREGMRLASRPDTSHITPDLARELAFRIKVGKVLDGDIARMGDRLFVTLRVTDVDGGKPLAVASDHANGPDALVPLLPRMVSRVLKDMGVSSDTARIERADFWSVVTPSFEAYQRFTEGARLYFAADYSGALRLYRAALSIDPDFAGAWMEVADCYGGLGEPDSSRMALEEAMRRRWRLSPTMQLFAEGRLADRRGDPTAALEAYDRIIRLDPVSIDASTAQGGRQNILIALGRSEEALDANDRLAAIRPHSQLSLAGRVRILIALGRLAEARAAAADLRGSLRQQADLSVLLAGSAWDGADTLASALERGPGTARTVLVQSFSSHAQVAAARGQVSLADECLRQAEHLQRAQGSSSAASRGGRARVFLAWVSGRTVPRAAPGLERDTSGSALITRAYRAATAGDTVAARRLVGALRARPTTSLGAHGNTPEFIEAIIAARGGQWSAVVDRMAHAARNGSDRGSQDYDRLGVAPERWLVAQAYERIGQPDSAAAFYRRLLAPGEVNLAHAFARMHLAVVCARMGKLAEAEQDLAILERDCLDPDPDVRRMLDEARKAVRTARALTTQLRQ